MLSKTGRTTTGQSDQHSEHTLERKGDIQSPLRYTQAPPGHLPPVNFGLGHGYEELLDLGHLKPLSTLRSRKFQGPTAAHNQFTGRKPTLTQVLRFLLSHTKAGDRQMNVGPITHIAPPTQTASQDRTCSCHLSYAANTVEHMDLLTLTRAHTH